MEPALAARLTLDEYLAFEASSPVAHEFRHGFAVAQAVPSRNHARIAMNLSIRLGAVARDSGCDAYAGDVKVLTSNGDRLIPDFVITCDARDAEGAGENGEGVIEHPWFVVEILSPTTAADDLTLKMDAYARIPELESYVVIDSRRRAIRSFGRAADGRFVASGPIESLSLAPHLACNLALEEIYADTTVPRIDEISPSA